MFLLCSEIIQFFSQFSHFQTSFRDDIYQKLILSSFSKAHLHTWAQGFLPDSWIFPWGISQGEDTPAKNYKGRKVPSSTESSEVKNSKSLLPGIGCLRFATRARSRSLSTAQLASNHMPTRQELWRQLNWPWAGSRISFQINLSSNKLCLLMVRRTGKTEAQKMHDFKIFLLYFQALQNIGSSSGAWNRGRLFSSKTEPSKRSLQTTLPHQSIKNHSIPP